MGQAMLRRGEQTWTLPPYQPCNAGPVCTRRACKTGQTLRYTRAWYLTAWLVMVNRLFDQRRWWTIFEGHVQAGWCDFACAHPACLGRIRPCENSWSPERTVSPSKFLYDARRLRVQAGCAGNNSSLSPSLITQASQPIDPHTAASCQLLLHLSKQTVV